MTAGVILFGPPGAGKDTVSGALSRLSPQFQHFPRAKCGPGNTVGYRMITSLEADRLRATGDVIWENYRYGATYFIERTALRVAIGDHIPVIGLGQEAAIAAVRAAFPDCCWLTVSLRCSRRTAAARVLGRGSSDIALRLAAWDETTQISADLDIDTDVIEPQDAALLIRRRIRTLCAGN